MTLRPALPRGAAALLFVAWLAGACGPPSPPVPPPDGGAADAGQDAGAAPDGGDAGEVDAGDPDFTCDVAAQDCDAGAACLHFETAGVFGAACFEGACDVVAQDCDVDEKCTWTPDDAGTSTRRCVPAGDGGTGAACTGTPTSDSCGAGSVCLPRPVHDGGVEAVCRPYCYRDADCAAGQLCFLMVQPPGTAERPFVCEAPCDLLGQDCTPGMGCYPGPVAPGCYAAGGVAVGGPCTWSDECVPGAACTGEGRCVALCGTDGGSPCASGTCSPIAVANAPGVGACL